MPGDPSVVGPYRLLGRLGSGGMGRVFLGRSTQGRTVAVKLVHAELATDPEFRQRFRREVQAARRVVGEWTAAVVAADTEATVPWAATAYVPALSLQEAVRSHGRLPESSVWALAFGLARALETIHGCGLVHRDLKPSNVLLGLDGPRVIDFGIARAVDGAGLTRTGMVVGTPGFISPEQVGGQSLTGASDVFCLGAVLVFAATGRSPFPATGEGVAAALLASVSQAPDLDGLSTPLHDLAAACLAREPARRPTPARIAELAESAGYDRSRPWLTPELLDHLGRVAARLLDMPTPAGHEDQGQDQDRDRDRDRHEEGEGHGHGQGLGQHERQDRDPDPDPGRGQAQGHGARQPDPHWPTQTAVSRPFVPGPVSPGHVAPGHVAPGPVGPADSLPPTPRWDPTPPTPPPPTGSSPSRWTRKWPLIVLTAAVLVLVAVLAPKMLRDKGEQNADGPRQSASSAPTASTTPEPAASTASASPHPTHSAASPSPYKGTWRGTVTQEGSEFPVIVVYKGGKVGDTVATISYPSVPCSGHWVLVAEKDHGVVVQELIDKGKDKGCTDSKNTFTRSANGTMEDASDYFRGTLKRD